MTELTWNVEHLATVDSTNAWLAQRARDGIRAGTAVFADFQSAGRGRRDRQWVAPRGSSLLCSVLLDCRKSRGAVQLFVIAAALSLVESLDELTSVRPSLKWPNDVMYAESKVAGLLGEVVEDYVVVGLGLNLDSVDPAFPSGTCVREATGAELGASQVLEKYLSALSRRLELLGSDGGASHLREEFINNLSTMGRWVKVELTNEVLRGRVVGVDDTGALLIETKEEMRVVSAGDVVHLRGEETT